MFWLNGKSIKICSKSSNPLYFFPPSKMNEVVQELFSSLSINYKFLQLLIKKGFNNFNSLVLKLLRVFKIQNINLTRFFIFIFFKLRIIGGIKVKVFKRRRKIVKIFFSPQNLNYNLQFRKGLHFFFKGLKLRKEKSTFLKLKSEIYDSLLLKSTLTFFKKKLMYESLVLYKKFSKFIKKKKKKKLFI